MTLIRLSKVTKSYHEGSVRRSVLQGTDAEFPHGKFIVIEGRSGSGKSTLLHLLAGIDLPDSGEVAINGQIINQLTERQRTLFRRKHIGFVFQSFNLIPTLTVAENLRFPLELNGIDGEPARLKIRELLEGFSLADREHSFPDQLSGGEQQRIATCRAIIHTPLLVLADEPTGNLDLETELEVLEILKELPRRHNITVICATHSEEIASIADQVYRLDSGCLQDR